MFIFIFGVVCGMWLAQTFAMPNVQATISRWSQSAAAVEQNEQQNEQQNSPEAPPPPVFTGEMPEIKQ